MRPTAARTLALTSAILALLLSTARSAGEKHLSVYSPVAVYTLPVQEKSGHDYVGILELLEPLGRVSSTATGRSLSLRYNAVDAEFSAGKARARIHGRDVDLTAPFLIENSRGMIPVSSINVVLPRFLGAAVNFHEPGRRLLVGGVGIQPTFQLDGPSRLVVGFPAAVNPTISTEPGLLRMVFKRDPVILPEGSAPAFDSKVISHADFSESDGTAELAIASTEPLIASFSGDRKTITISSLQPQAGTPAPGQPSSAPSAAGPATSGNAPSGGANHRPLAVVDAAHGGDERGAALSDTLAEKDVTIGLARLLRHELEIRGFSVLMLREGDTSLSLDQRASVANTGHASVYVSLHAASQGTGVHIYTSLLPVEGTSKGPFHAWNAAQTPSLPVSRNVSSAIVAEMQKRQFPVRASSASLRPLNNVFMPAIAVELAPGPGGLSDLTSANYQQRAAAAVADGIAAVRDRLGAQQ